KVRLTMAQPVSSPEKGGETTHVCRITYMCATYMHVIQHTYILQPRLVRQSIIYNKALCCHTNFYCVLCLW
uniref:Uncharacterized protein n=2 Tax=Aegilops tauschii subsp. strangulata TaxID=200361 RepID=A0A453MPW5_AEGTS